MPASILYVVGKDPLWEVAGGHASYVRAHARAAMRAGFEPHLFCASEQPGVVRTDYGWVHCLPSWAVRRIGRNRIAPVVVPLLAAALEQHGRTHPGPHLVHSFAFWGAAGVRAAHRLVATGIQAVPIVSFYTTLEHEYAAMVRGLGQHYGVRHRVRMRLLHAYHRVVTGRYEREAAEESRVVAVNYASVRQLLAAKYPNLSAVHKIGYASEQAFLRGTHVRPPRSRVPLIVSVSRHDARKGLDVLIHALGRLRATGAVFRARLAGPGELLELNRALVRQLGLSDIVSVEGFVPDVFGLLTEADIFALPSLEEGSGSVSLLEAFQAGVAVVASACDGIPEDVESGANGVLVRPGDVGELARALGRLVADPVLRVRLARAARITFESRFTGDAFVKELRVFYENLGFSP